MARVREKRREKRRASLDRSSDTFVQRLQVARRDLCSRSRDRQARQISSPILDDIAYVAKDQAETSVLFELISARHERRYLLITANQPFGEWGKIFPNPTLSWRLLFRTLHALRSSGLAVRELRGLLPIWETLPPSTHAALRLT
ncbi:ATP-binding protein [Methylocystis sp. IM3]|uniref:ATP-binding protein n=1 Tax=unclassified Methylocystis TaxID=2625913 RepID=UPI0030FC0DCE